ncbi:sensor domain-containing diguanylate cyclase [Permianibacter sp. IMCC34836]|uniref:diguanylate cyclase domain-containing protein n=1 Tax=Permianibacter fluminis TaxID=2738515 RepID=UPI001557B9FF|nr:diguanylate cyclase [Permianibacter fluminis]NQD36706.1 sensor domain-containing diguanylate cyclase [Permianibacter fluminis]
MQNRPAAPMARQPSAASEKWDYLAIAAGLLAGLLALVLGSYLVWLEVQRGREEQRGTVLAEAGAVRSKLESELNSSLYLGWGIVAFVSANPDFTLSQFDKVAATLLRLRPNIRNLALAPDNVIRYVYPLAGNERALGLRYLDTPGQRESIERLMRDWKPILNGPIELAQGGLGLINRIPVLLSQPDGTIKYWGLVSVALDTRPIFASAGLDKEGQVEFALRGRDGLGANGDVFLGAASLFEQADAELLDVSLPGGNWQLAARPRAGWTGTRSATQIFAMYTLSSLLSLAMGVMVGMLIADRKKIQRLARHDPLTGAANRLRFDERAFEIMALARRSQRKFVLLNLDLNGFKRINDDFGHAAGDALLVHVARQLQECLRETDFMARIGGDEFLVLLPDTEPGSSLNAVVDRVHRAVSRPLLFGVESLSVGVSIGIASYPENGSSIDELMSAADHAMYASKGNGLSASV